MSEFRRLVAEALAATEVLSRTAYAWFGARSQGLPPEAEDLMGPDSTRAYLLYSLQTRLYTDFYCAGAARRELHNPEAATPAGSSSFLGALSNANQTRQSREAGWTYLREEPRAVVLSHREHGLQLWVRPEEMYTLGDGAPGPGTQVGVLMPKELLRLSPGFYMALGEAEFPTDGSALIVRHYWNLRSEGGSALVSAITTSLNAKGLAFRLKVVSDPARYSRCDAGVLYTLLAQQDTVGELVREVYALVAPALKPSVPALTKPLEPGLAVAEDPGEQAVSFGMSRCSLLAEAIVEAAEHGLERPEQRLAVAEQRFARDGISLDAPYLNPGSVDRYALAPR
jgi:hypothetical protein